MLPTIASGNVASATAGGFEVSNSCRFNAADDELMYKAGVSGNRDTDTMSYWIKRTGFGSSDGMRVMMFSGTDSTSGTTNLLGKFGDDHTFVIVDNTGAGNHLSFTTTRLFRDASAWYNIIIAVDTTQAVEANRMKLYVNGVQETAFSTGDYPTQNTDTLLGAGSSYEFTIGGWKGNDNQYTDMYLAEVVHIDGLQLAPTSFGEFDGDTPTIWKPIDVSGLTFGNNGFYLDFRDSANLGNDANGGTDFTETNIAAINQTTDTPTNNFCVMNIMTWGPSTNFSNVSITEEGSLYFKQVAGVNSQRRWVSTVGVTSGKWYFEAICTAGETGACVGISDQSQWTTYGNNYIGELSLDVGYNL